MNLSKAADCIRMSTASSRSLSLPLRVLIRCDSSVTSFLLLKHYGKSSLTIATRSSPIATGPVSTSSGWPFVIKSEQIQMTKRMMFFTKAMVDITHLPGALRQRVSTTWVSNYNSRPGWNNSFVNCLCPKSLIAVLSVLQKFIFFTDFQQVL